MCLGLNTRKSRRRHLAPPTRRPLAPIALLAGSPVGSTQWFGTIFWPYSANWHITMFSSIAAQRHSRARLASVQSHVHAHAHGASTKGLARLFVACCSRRWTSVAAFRLALSRKGQLRSPSRQLSSSNPWRCRFPGWYANSAPPHSSLQKGLCPCLPFMARARWTQSRCQNWCGADLAEQSRVSDRWMCHQVAWTGVFIAVLLISCMR